MLQRRYRFSRNASIRASQLWRSHPWQSTSAGYASRGHPSTVGSTRKERRGGRAGPDQSGSAPCSCARSQTGAAPAAPARSQMCETERPDLGGDGCARSSHRNGADRGRRPEYASPGIARRTASRPAAPAPPWPLPRPGPPSAKSAPRRPRRASGRRGPPPRRSPPPPRARAVAPTWPSAHRRRSRTPANSAGDSRVASS